MMANVKGVFWREQQILKNCLYLPHFPDILMPRCCFLLALLDDGGPCPVLYDAFIETVSYESQK